MSKKSYRIDNPKFDAKFRAIDLKNYKSDYSRLLNIKKLYYMQEKLIS